ncbi:hypothetical protein LGM45_05240 [Burkholderia cepacia]|uniref:hypothetical protein n=1 Tax=Burkholderia cepacia TaxID=292 RepID=UPI001CF41D09|nr:hypothetical protein [Burkholderia cepacia]MCA7928433.1 hypothetical protein [Burkholderia cepacia]
MALLTIDLAAIEHAARKRTERQLVDYFCEVMAPILPRVPSTPAAVSRFVPLAAEFAVASGFPDGRPFGLHVAVSFLLGHNWPTDPFHVGVQRILIAPGVPLDGRLDQTMSAAIQHRRQLEAIQPKMHDVAIEFLKMPETVDDTDDVWRRFCELAQLRGVSPSNFDTLWALYAMYEADACRLHRYRGIEREKKLNYYDRLGYRHMQRRVPLPTDDYQGIEPRVRRVLIQHIFLALTFGRGFRTDPLLHGLQNAMDDTGHGASRSAALVIFLEQHQSVLREPSHGQ